MASILKRKTRARLSEIVSRLFDVKKKTAIAPLMHTDTTGKRRYYAYLYFDKLCSVKDLMLEHYLIHQLRYYIKHNRAEAEEGKERYGAFNNGNYENYFEEQLGVQFGEWLAANSEKLHMQWTAYSNAPFIHPYYLKLDAPLFPMSAYKKIMELPGEYIAIVLAQEQINIANQTKAEISANINYMMSTYLEENPRKCEIAFVVDRITPELAHAYFRNPAIIDALAAGEKLVFFQRKSEGKLVKSPYFFKTFKTKCDESAVA